MSRRAPTLASALLLATTSLGMVVGLGGCNHYELFLEAGYEQANFNNNADILFIIDNSDSMRPVAEGLALSFDQFIGKLTSSEGANVPRATLSDAVGNYLRENGGDSLFIDYQLAISTTAVDYSRGATSGIDAGEAGTLVGPVIPRTAPDVAADFRTQLLCQATCWDANTVASDPSFVCTEDPDPGDQVTSEYLDCVCGAGQWTNHCGSGNEMGLEGATMALCRALEDPPEECFQYADPTGSTTPKDTVMTEADIGSNDGLLRDDAITVVVIVTDEGDGSYREATGDSEIGPYEDLLSNLPNTVRLAVIGPDYEDGAMPCNSGGAQPWAVKRYENAVDAFQGAYVNIEEQDDSGTCAYTDFGTNLESIGDLLTNLLTFFPLQTVPDPATITVYVDGAIVDPSAIVSGSVDAGDAVYGDGWTYEADQNAVAFHGAAVPAYNSDVKIYYRPLGATPRTLPPSF